ncbi:MAG: hypothetical protein ACNA7Y_03590, partial [Gammaproteobacteria bacterium]
EYNFEADDNNSANTIASTTTVVSSSGAGIFSILADKRKIILIAIGIFVSIIVLFKTLGGIFTSSETAITPVPSVETPPILHTEEPGATNILNARINMLENRLRENASQMAEVQKKIMQLEATLTDGQTQLVTMHQLMEAMSQRLQEYAKQVASKTHKKIEVPQYYIQAMVAGRAWLINPKGTVTTVSIGDDIPGYGVITAIDIQQGTVSTHQGKVIRYHSEDR